MRDPLTLLYEQVLLKEFTEPTIKKLVSKFANDASEDEIRQELNDFEKYKNGIQIKDPFQYKSWLDFTEAIHAAKGKANFKKGSTGNRVQQNQVNQDDIIADDENVTIYRGDSQDKCVLYGQGYTFCISRPAGGNMFSNYRLGKESTFYFIYFKKKPKSAKDHIMVLDYTKNGYEWTFADNNTREVKGGWNEIIKKYPELTPYKNLLVNKKLTTTEKDIVKQIQSFTDEQTLEKFNSFDYATKVQAVKTVVNLRDDIFVTLDSTLRNEFISIGPNLTPHQADSLKESEIKRYTTTRDISFKQLNESDLYKFNKHDVNVPNIKVIIDKDTKIAAEKVASGKYDLFGLMIVSLPTGIPDVIGGNFNCMNTPLQSLEGAPQEVGGNFSCTNTQITSLKGAPRKVGGVFNCRITQIKSLEGAPRKVGGDFVCAYTPITSLKGAPREVGGDFYCSYTPLQSLEGAPQKVGGSFDCSYTSLQSLEGAPQEVGGSFDCSYTPLRSLEGAPQEVNVSFDCTNTQITSLKGAPRKVGRDFNCKKTPLQSLEGAPQEIGRSFYHDLRENVKYTFNMFVEAIKRVKTSRD